MHQSRSGRVLNGDGRVAEITDEVLETSDVQVVCLLVQTEAFQVCSQHFLNNALHRKRSCCWSKRDWGGEVMKAQKTACLFGVCSK